MPVPFAGAKVQKKSHICKYMRDFFGIIYEIYFLAASARLSYHLSLGVEDMEMRRLVSCQEPIIERESAFDLFFDIVWEVIEEVYAGGLFYFIDR